MLLSRPAKLVMARPPITHHWPSFLTTPLEKWRLVDVISSISNTSQTFLGKEFCLLSAIHREHEEVCADISYQASIRKEDTV